MGSVSAGFGVCPSVSWGHPAQIHAGHVFTVGHAYKLLDDGFYMHPGTPEGLTFEQSLRFVGRAAASFVLTPLPWEVRSRGELALLPEHMIWYLMLVLAPIGLVAGWKRSPLLTCVLVGYAIPMVAVIAVTNGNVGTLLRLRALVTPQLVWVSAIVTTVATLIGLRAPQTYTAIAQVMIEPRETRIVNAEKVALSGTKRDTKYLYRHSGYPGGLRRRTVGEMLDRHPERLVEKAVQGMLPKNRLGRAMARKLKVYAGPNHPHAAQKPAPFEITQVAQ